LPYEEEEEEFILQTCIQIKANKKYKTEISTVSTTPRAEAKIFVTRMLTRDLFAIANILV